MNFNYVGKQSHCFIDFITNENMYTNIFIICNEKLGTIIQFPAEDRMYAWTDILEYLIINLHCEQTISSKKKPIGSACYGA